MPLSIPLSASGCSRVCIPARLFFFRAHPLFTPDKASSGLKWRCPFFALGGSPQLLRHLTFRFLCLLAYLLFLVFVPILFAFVSHCLPPFSVAPRLLAARTPPRCFCRKNQSRYLSIIILRSQRPVNGNDSVAELSICKLVKI